ncbi:pyridoxamine 5'-phosphate oxidase family protein [Prolixibacteraceae bacterium JC049]|nr:pyridoxamine 5'-phosphate oxidase family protein [Prolixibacteraceae bacterium JC049]
MEQTIKNIEAYLQTHGLLTLATVSAEGQPMAHSVEYISEGNTVYFISHEGTRKVANIKENSKVAYTVDEDYQDWSQIQGIQMEGKASFIEEENEKNRIRQKYVERFPQVMNFPPEFAQAMCLIKVEPIHAKYIDNTKGMGHHELVKY